MNEEKYFLEAISAGEPNADLIYADWLEEQGRPEADEIRDPAIFVLCEWSRSWSWSGSRSGSRSGSWPWSWSRSRSGSWSRSRSCSGCRSLSRSRSRSRPVYQSRTNT